MTTTREQRMLRELNIAGMVCPNNIFLAPMAGYTTYPYRKMCLSLGAGLTFTEMVSCKGLKYGNEETKSLLYCGEEAPRAAQIFGSDPDIMRAACESEALAPFDLIDINMGCPMPKIVKNGEGSALLENPVLAEKIISACAKSGKRISVKFRIGVDERHLIASEFARRCEGAGACMISVHGRTRDKIYAGPPDYEQIAAAKHAVNIPVIANGGIWNKQAAQEMLERTGADGVMIARAALYNPRVFCELADRELPPLLPLFSELLSATRELSGERFACVFLRKMAAFWVKGRQGANSYKRRLFEATSTAEVERLAIEIFKEE